MLEQKYLANQNRILTNYLVAKVVPFFKGENRDVILNDFFPFYSMQVLQHLLVYEQSRKTKRPRQKYTCNF